MQLENENYYSGVVYNSTLPYPSPCFQEFRFQLSGDKFPEGQTNSERLGIGMKKISSRDSIFFLKSCLGEHELISERAGEHRHHTNNEGGKAPLTAETRDCWKPGVKHGGAAVSGLSGRPLAGALTTLVFSVKELAKCQEGE